MSDGRRRCPWGGSTPEYVAYHDEEWGRPVTDDRGIYERLCSRASSPGCRGSRSCASARASARPSRASRSRRSPRFGRRDVSRLLADAGIVRHRGKIEAAIANAGRRPRSTWRSPSWSGRTPRAAGARAPRALGDVPAITPESTALLEGAQAARLPLRRPDDRVRGDAGVRDRQRPRRRLLGARPRSSASGARSRRL